jgi:hypothetical protein
MNAAIEIALEREDYAAVERLLQTLDQDDVWLNYYRGRILESRERWEEAENLYRQVLQQVTAPKVVLASRQRLQEIQAVQKQLEDEQKQRQKAALTEAVSSSGKTGLGLLMLQALSGDKQLEAARVMANIFNLDPYSARLLIPGRGIKLYRCGALAEIEYYGQQLETANIPALWIDFKAIETVKVYSVAYLETTTTGLRAVLHPDAQTESLHQVDFRSGDIVQRVEGALPIFEEVVDRDARGKLKRKEQTQDYAHLCDLHLSKQSCILRFCDATYQYKKGIQLGKQAPKNDPFHFSTSYVNWRELNHWLAETCNDIPLAAEFETFASTALDHPEMLMHLDPHINLFRRSDSPWDAAFHLYSCVLWLKLKQSSAI